MAQIGTNTWNAITYGNGLYVVGGGINDEGGWIAYSTNGLVWQTTKITGIRGVHDVIFDGPDSSLPEIQALKFRYLPMARHGHQLQLLTTIT